MQHILTIVSETISNPNWGAIAPELHLIENSNVDRIISDLLEN